jgi:hypothetical protein
VPGLAASVRIDKVRQPTTLDDRQRCLDVRAHLTVDVERRDDGSNAPVGFGNAASRAR